MWIREIKRLGLPKLHNIRQIKRSNVVCHVSFRMSPLGKMRRLRMGVLPHQLMDDETTKAEGQRLIRLGSNTNPNNPFAHLLLEISGYPGKLLAFDENEHMGNMIRNGKHSQPEHLALIFRFIRFTNRPWFAGIAIPNNVISAIFENPIGAEIKEDSRANFSPKFPGISIISPRKGRSKSKCTPIIYIAYNAKERIQRRSSVNFAGPRTASDLIYHVELVDKMSLQYPSKHKLDASSQKDDDPPTIEEEDEGEDDANQPA
jgi:hypothetical protein